MAASNKRASWSCFVNLNKVGEERATCKFGHLENNLSIVVNEWRVSDNRELSSEIWKVDGRAQVQKASQMVNSVRRK